jgi:hypothetical protein
VKESIQDQETVVKTVMDQAGIRSVLSWWVRMIKADQPVHSGRMRVPLWAGYRND